MKLPFWGQNSSHLVHNLVTVMGHSSLGQLSTLVHLRHSHTLVHFGQKLKYTQLNKQQAMKKHTNIGISLS